MKKIGWAFLLMIFSIGSYASMQDILSESKKDQEIMNQAGIKVVEKFQSIPIEFSQGENFLFETAKRLLDKEYDLYNAFRILSYLYLNFKKDQYAFELGKAYYFMGEMYYEGYTENNYKKAYEIFEKLTDKDDKNIEYLRWHSYAAAKVGLFIRHKERGKLSGISYLRESISLNDDILKRNKNDVDAWITEGEYQIESSSIPIFGGSEEKGKKIFDNIYQKNPNNMRIHIMLAKYYYQRKNDPLQGIPYLEKAINLFENKQVPQDMLHYYMYIFAHLHLYRAYMKLNERGKAYESLKKHLSLLPRSPSGLKALRDFTWEVHQNKALACVLAKRVVEVDPFGREEEKRNLYCR